MAEPTAVATAAATAAASLAAPNAGRRAWLAAGLTLPVLVCSLILPPSAAGRLLQLVLATAVVFGTGLPLLPRKLRGESSCCGARSDAICTPCSPRVFGLAVLCCFALALLLLLAGAPALCFDAAAVLVTLEWARRALERRGAREVTAVAAELADLLPAQVRKVGAAAESVAPRPTATRPEGSGDSQPESGPQSGVHEEQIPLHAVRTGDRLGVLPGERIPVDGMVAAGVGEVDESWLDGEAVNVPKATGDRMVAGTLCLGGPLVVRALRVGRQTALWRAVGLLEQAVAGSRRQRTAERLASLLLLLATATALLRVALGLWPSPATTPAAVMFSVVGLLVAASPTALLGAVPAVLLAARARAARRGVVVRRVEALEGAAATTVVAFRPAGTVTADRLAVVDFAFREPGQAARLLSLAAGCTRGCEPPVLRAVHRYALARGAHPVSVEGRSLLEAEGDPAGSAVRALVAGEEVLVGGQASLQRAGVDFSGCELLSTEARRSSRTLVYIAAQGRACGLFAVAYPTQTSAAQAVGHLRDLGIQAHMLSDEESRAAKEVAGELGIDQVQAGVRSKDLSAVVCDLRSRAHVVTMVGDSIDHAAALAAADLAVGSLAFADDGRDGATVDDGPAHAGPAHAGPVDEQAPILSIHADLAAAADTVQIGRLGRRLVRQNLGLGLACNGVALILAGSGLLGPQGPVVAAMLTAAGSAGVVANSWRMHRLPLWP